MNPGVVMQWIVVAVIVAACLLVALRKMTRFARSFSNGRSCDGGGCESCEAKSVMTGSRVINLVPLSGKKDRKE
ncbi:MAG: FeoB-associated Cys-rich membrane protein [Planctomycetes bacterium]|nr:FeoB-associated Cys-rich membrane protein [Planctomycetota bacterium]